jgi:hypothetical protein
MVEEYVYLYLLVASLKSVINDGIFLIYIQKLGFKIYGHMCGKMQCLQNSIESLRKNIEEKVHRSRSWCCTFYFVKNLKLEIFMKTHIREKSIHLSFK